MAPSLGAQTKYAWLLGPLLLAVLMGALTVASELPTPKITAWKGDKSWNRALPYSTRILVSYGKVNHTLEAKSDVPSLKDLTRVDEKGVRRFITKPPTRRRRFSDPQTVPLHRDSRQGDYGWQKLNFSLSVIYKIVPELSVEMEVLYKLLEIHEDSVDFLREPYDLQQEVLLRVNEKFAQDLSTILDMHSMRYTIVQDFSDLENRFQSQPEFGMAQRRKRVWPAAQIYSDLAQLNSYTKEEDELQLEESSWRRGPSASKVAPTAPFNWTFYKTYNSEASYERYWLALQRKYQNFAKLETIGHTILGRPIYMFKIGLGLKGNFNHHPIVLIDALHKAREWSTLSTATYLVEQILADMSSGTPLGPALRDYNYFVIPMVNPDGYSFSRQRNPFWKKNRYTRGGGNSDTDSRCIGVDLSRNYPRKTPHNTTVEFPGCSNYERGYRPLDQFETNAVNSVMKKFARQIKLYLSLTAYGKMLELPKMKSDTGDTGSSNDDGTGGRRRKSPCRIRHRGRAEASPQKDTRARGELRSVANKFVQVVDGLASKPGSIATKRTTPASYTVGLLKRRRVDDGSSVEHAYDTYGIKLSFSLRLPPHSSSNHNLGLYLTPDETESVARETYSGVLGLVETL